MNADAPRVAALQMNSGADVGRNLTTAGTLLERASGEGATLAVLPENFAFMGAHERDKLAIAETGGGRGPIQEFLAAAARRFKLWIVAGTVPLSTEHGARVSAASLVFDAAGTCVARYDKMHLFDVEVPAAPGASAGDSRGMTPAGGEKYQESASIAPGEVAIRVVDTPVGKLGLSVCYDLRFPELYRELMKQGAELLAVPSAFTQRTGEAHWDVLLRARAIENQCYVIAPGQWGQHPGGRHTYGHSSIIDPWGRVLAQQAAGEGAIVAPLPREPLLNLRRSFPVLGHRRLT